MRLFVPCMACQIENGVPDFVSYPADLLDQGIARFTCRHGHQSVSIVQSHKFELLGEIAVHAILDGYYRDAVSSFTSALERFYEFYIKVTFIGQGHKEDEFDELWKKVTVQSERQLGAYLFVSFLSDGEIPVMLDDRKCPFEKKGWVNFRNKVIHQGRIPTRDEAVLYGQAITDIINTASAPLMNKHASIVEDLEWKLVGSGHRQARDDETRSTHGMPTLLSCHRSGDDQLPTVLSWMDYSQKMRNALPPIPSDAVSAP